MSFVEIEAMGKEPSAIALEPFVVAYLDEHGPTETTELASAVEAAWLGAHGSPSEGDVRPVLKRVLDRLTTCGSVVQEGVFGAWRVVGRHEERPPGREAVASGTSRLSDIEADSVEVTLADDGDDGRELGTGEQFVYCLYLPTYRREAERNGQQRWPIRIGGTTSSLDAQIAAETATLPEHPVVAVILRTHDADQLEAAIGIVLGYRGQRISEAGGSGWYRTNPDEIVEIFAFLRADRSWPRRNESDGARRGLPESWPSDADADSGRARRPHQVPA